MKKNWQSIDLFLVIYRNNFFRLRHITPRHRCQLPIIRFAPKYHDQTLVNFSASPAGDWQTGCLWWEVVESRFHLDLMSNFASKNNSMEFLHGPITRRINVLYESRMKWTWHHSKLAVEEVSFFGGLKSGTPSTIIYTRWSSRRHELGCDAPVVLKLVPIWWLQEEININKYFNWMKLQ